MLEIVRQNKLSESDAWELNLLEDSEFRTNLLCRKLNLVQSNHLSWVDLCSIISPTNPSRIADKIFKWSNDDKKYMDGTFVEIQYALYYLGDGDEKFYACDVLWLDSIAIIIYEQFRDVWELIIERMKKIHYQFESLDLDEVFVKAVLELRLCGSLDGKDDLFSCDKNGKFRLN